MFYYQFIKTILVLFYVGISQLSASDASLKIVETTRGFVRGKQLQTLYDDKPYHAFKGIPYAEPPLGNIRFKAPVPKDPWTGIKDAYEHGHICLQKREILSQEIEGNEDCLYLNVYTPNVSPKRKMSVMVFIHGGFLYEGDGNSAFFGPDFFINENVVLVTINYRLNIFGFLSLGTPEYSGNMGLKDQQLALKWVKENIENFGGDNHKITIFGHSSGSASVHYQVMAHPLRSQLFQRALLMSGAALQWSLYDGRNHVGIVAEMARELGYSVRNNNSDLVSFLNVASSDEIIGKMKSVMPELQRNYKLDFLPVIEDENAITPFLLKSPTEKYIEHFRTDIDVMFGATKDEWLGGLSIVRKQPELLTSLDQRFQIPVPFHDLNNCKGSQEYNNLMAEIRNYYFGEGVAINNNTLNELYKLMSDAVIVYEVEKTLELHRKVSTGKIFYYRFSIDSTFNALKIILNIELPGTSHGDELCYLFRCNYFDKQYNESAGNSVQVQGIRNTVKLWTNFAKYGNPTPNSQPVDFRPISRNRTYMLDIKNEGLNLTTTPNTEMVKFWDNLHKKYKNACRGKISFCDQ